MLKKALSIILSISVLLGTMGTPLFTTTAHAAEIPTEMTPYEDTVENPFVNLYDNPDGFISGSTLIFNNDANFQDRVRNDLKRMREIYHVNTVGVYDLVNMSVADRTFFFNELLENDQKVAIRIEHYAADDFTFSNADADEVMAFYNELLTYIKTNGFEDEVAYFAVNMPVDDPTVAANFAEGREDQAWSDNQAPYVNYLNGKLRDFFDGTIENDDETCPDLYVSIFYGWDLAYATPTYTGIENEADGYFLNNYCYPPGGVAPRSTDPVSTIISQSVLQAAMDRMMAQYPTEPKIIEYGFHTAQFNDYQPVSQTAGLVYDADTKKIALKAVTNFYKTGTSTVGGVATSFNFRGSLYFAQNLYKEEGSPSAMMDWALDYPSTVPYQAEDPLTTVYTQTPDVVLGSGVNLDSVGEGVSFFNFNEGTILEVKYVGGNDSTVELYVNGAYVKDVTLDDQKTTEYVNANVPLQGSVELRLKTGVVLIDEVFVYGNYEADVNTTLTGAAMTADPDATFGNMVAMEDGNTVEFEEIKSGNQLTIGYNSDEDGLLGLYVNGSLVQNISFELTDEYVEKTIPVYIPAGANVKLALVSGSINLDYINVNGLYEAEYASGKYNGALSVVNNSASNNTVVNGIVTKGASAVFTAVISGSQLKIRYSNGSGADRSLTLYVTGQTPRSITFPATADANTFADVYVDVAILDKATVILQRDTGNDGTNLNLDYISIMGWLEAEAVSQNGTTITGDANASNGKVAVVDDETDYVQLDDVKAGSQLQIRYSSEADHSLSLYVNGRDIASVEFPTTGVGLFATITTNISIPAGADVKLQYDTADGDVSLDTFVIIENTEAENANFAGGAATYSDIAASGGMGSELNGVDESAEYTNLKSGNKLAIKYTCDADATIAVYVNNVKVKDIVFNSTGAIKGKYNTQYVDLDVPSNTTVKFVDQTGDRIRIDNFSVIGISEAESAYAQTGLSSVEDATASNGLAMGDFDTNDNVTFINSNGASSVTFRYKSDENAQLSVYLRHRDVTNDTAYKFAPVESYAKYEIGNITLPDTNGVYSTVTLNVDFLDLYQLVLQADEDDTVGDSFALDYVSFTDKYMAIAADLTGTSEGAVNVELAFEDLKAANRVIIGYTNADADTTVYTLQVTDSSNKVLYTKDVTFKPAATLAERVVDVDVPKNGKVTLINQGTLSSIDFDYIQLTGVYEAENGNFSGHTRAWYLNQAGQSGSLWAWGFADLNDGTEVINVRSGNQVTVAYGNENTSSQFGMYVNGNKTGEVVLPYTGSWGNYKTVTNDQVVPAGSNINLLNDTGSTTMTYDYLEVSDTHREAENANLYGDANTCADVAASYGLAVNGLNGLNDAVEFTNMNQGCQININYTAQEDGKLSLYINGIKKQDIDFPATGGWSGNFDVITVTTGVPEGADIKLQFDNGGNPIVLDNIEVTGSYPANNMYQAENGVLSGGLTSVVDGTASAGYTVGPFADDSSVVIPGVKTADALLVKYSATADSTLALYVNNKKIQEVTFTNTTGAFATKEIIVHIPNGVSVEFKNESGSVAAMYMDYFKISDKYEAEYGILLGQSNDATPIPFKTEAVGNASNGYATACFWAPDNGSGSIEIEDVKEGSALLIRYAKGDDVNRKLSLYINDVDTTIDVVFPTYDDRDWNGKYNAVIVPVAIAAGDDIKIQKDPGDSEVNFDYFQVLGTYEAEDGVMIGTAVTQNNNNASNGICVANIFNASGFEITSANEGDKIDITYASNVGGEVYVYVNEASTKVVLEGTGSNDTYVTKSIFAYTNVGDSVKVVRASGEVSLDKIRVKLTGEVAPTSFEITSQMDGTALLVEYSSTLAGTMSLYVDGVKKMEVPFANTNGASTVKELKLDIPNGKKVRMDFLEGMSVAKMTVSDKFEAEYGIFSGHENENLLIHAVEDTAASNGYRVVFLWGPNHPAVEFTDVVGGTHITMGYSCAVTGMKTSVFVDSGSGYIDTGVDIAITDPTNDWGGNGNYKTVTVEIPGGIPDGADVKLMKADGDDTNFFMDYIKISTPSDAIIPTAPTEVTASKTARLITLNWSGATDNVGVIGYDIFEDGVKVGTTSASSLSIRGLIPSTTHNFTVVAKDEAGNDSEPSEVCTVTTDAAETGTNVKYEAEFAKLYGVENIQVAGDGAASNGEKVVCIWGPGAYLEFSSVIEGTMLTVGYASGDPGRKISVYINGVDSGVDVPFISTGGYGGAGHYLEATIELAIPAGATVKLQRDGDDNTDVHIDYIKVFTPTVVDTTAPIAPTGLTSSSVSTASIVLSWTAATDNVGVVGYDIYKDGVKINTVNVTATTYTVTGLTASTTYNFTVKAKDAAGNTSAASNAVSITTNSVVVPNPTPTPTTDTIEVKTVVVGTTAEASTDSATVAKAFEKAAVDENGAKTIQIDVKPAVGVNEYSMELPKNIFNTDQPKKGEIENKIEINTPLGSVTLPLDMFKSSDLKKGENVEISIGTADLTDLDTKTKALIGDKPVIEINASVNGETISWRNNDAPVSISIDYTPTVEELKHPEAIVIWYIDGKGKATAVPNGKYDPATGKITFTTTHFSKYAVAYNFVAFTDAGKYKWAQHQIEVMASKGIMTGTSEKEFSPEAFITRGEFIDTLVKSLSLSAEFTQNFSDVNQADKWYQSIGIAKALGITNGAGNNKFNPSEKISRQDMATLVVRAMKLVNEISTLGNASDLKKYSDASQIAKYAIENMATLVNEGILIGSGNTINPKDQVTRAQAAVIAYRIYNVAQ